MTPSSSAIATATSRFSSGARVVVAGVEHEPAELPAAAAYRHLDAAGRQQELADRDERRVLERAAVTEARQLRTGRPRARRRSRRGRTGRSARPAPTTRRRRSRRRAPTARPRGTPGRARRVLPAPRARRAGLGRPSSAATNATIASTTNVATSSLLAMRSDRYGWVNTKSKRQRGNDRRERRPASRPPMIAPSSTGSTSASAMSAFGR